MANQISKEQVVEELTNLGYEAKIVDNTVMINAPTDEFVFYRRILSKLGYWGSFGLRKENNGEFRQ